MNEFHQDTTIKGLITQIQQLEDQLREAPQYSPVRSEYQAQLDQMYANVGRYVVSLVTDQATAVTEQEALIDATTPALEELSHADEPTDVVEREFVFPSGEGDLQGALLEDDPWLGVTSSAPDAWVAQLRQLLDRLHEPAAWSDPKDIAIEGSRLLWATSQIQHRWALYPEPVQVALLGMLAARCRHILDQLSVDVGMEHALARLRAYQHAQGLALVVGLVMNQPPEFDTWPEDAAHWWLTLRSGLTLSEG